MVRVNQVIYLEGKFFAIGISSLWLKWNTYEMPITYFWCHANLGFHIIVILAKSIWLLEYNFYKRVRKTHFYINFWVFGMHKVFWWFCCLEKWFLLILMAQLWESHEVVSLLLPMALFSGKAKCYDQQLYNYF